MSSYNPYYYPPPSPYYPNPTYYPYPGAAPPQYPCRICNSPMAFLPMYQEWFCSRCQRYASEMDDVPTELQAQEVAGEPPLEISWEDRKPSQDGERRRGTFGKENRKPRGIPTRQCVICNTVNTGDLEYCTECGHHLFRCRSCGNKNERGSLDCTSCGHRLER